MPSVRLRLVASLALALGACGGAPERPGVPPRHVLLITIEGLRADHVSSLGYERRTTSLLRPDQPIVLDLGHVAQRGVSFAQAFALSAHPEPSVAALLGGGPPPGAEPPAPAGAARTPGAGLAEDFAAAGLRTAAFVNGRSFEPSRRSAQGFGRGFAEASFHASDEEALAAAVAWLQAEVPAGEPHFTWIHLAGPTPPFAGPPLEDRFSVRDYAGPVRAEEEVFARLAAGELELGPDDRRRLVDLYDGRVVRVTELVNSFFFLYKHNFGDPALWDDTLIAVAGVSGCDLGEDGGRVAGRDSLREEALRVPLLLRHPRSLTGERIYAEVVTLLDLGATLRDWFRTPGRGAGAGRSLLALTDRGRTDAFERRGALAVTPDGAACGLRVPGLRLVARREAVELYELTTDPRQRHDLSASRPAEVARLLEELDARRVALGLAPWPRHDQAP